MSRKYNTIVTKDETKTAKMSYLPQIKVFNLFFRKSTCVSFFTSNIFQ